MSSFVCMECGAITSPRIKHTIEDCKKWIEMLIEEEIKRNKKQLKEASKK